MTIPMGLPNFGTFFDSANKPTPQFFFFLHQLWTRSGGVEGPSTNELALMQFEDAGIEEAKWSLAQLADAIGQRPMQVDSQQDGDQSSELSALRSEVDRLRVAVEALQQGTP